MRAYEWKTALILTLATMILMRLVWMDLRSYVVTFSPQNRYALEQSEPCARALEPGLALKLGENLLPRPGWAHAWAYHSIMKLSCRNGIFSVGGFVRYNQGLLITTVLLLVLLARIVTRSWILGLIVAVALLSRGRLIAALGQIGADQLIGLGLALWGLTFAHWVRSGSYLMLALNYACILWLVPLEPSMLFLAGVLPLLMTKLGSFVFAPGQEEAKEEGAKPAVGNLFRPAAGGVGALLDEARYRRRIWAFALWGLVLVAAEFLLLTLLRNDPILRRGSDWSLSEYQAWLQAWFLPVDRDLGLGLICMFLILLLARRSRVLGIRPLIAVTLAGVILSSMGSLIGDWLFLPGSASRLWMGPRLLLWWEPLLLALSMLAFFDLVLDLLPRAGPTFLLSKWLRPKQNL